MDSFVRVSPRDRRYFELSDGSPYLPIGCNLAVARDASDAHAAALQMSTWLDRLAAAGGNFARLWLSAKSLHLEPEAGRVDPVALDAVRRVVDHARGRGVRLKLCFEHFRYLLPQRPREHLLKPEAFARTAYHLDHGGPLRDMADYLTSPAGRGLFLHKLDHFARHFADEPAIFGWELWNEMNCVHADGWLQWTADMLGELRARFPHHLVMQSLGSLDSVKQQADYAALAQVAGQDVAQVHRYLDEGAPMPVCHGPLDVALADAVTHLRTLYPTHPLLLAESGAVEPRHAGPWRHYPDDTQGQVLHDVLFAGFFSGGAGPGHAWHWDGYIDRLNLWGQFRRFADAIRGIDVPGEGFEPFTQSDAASGVRVWGLRGERVTLAWLRDAAWDWRAQFERREQPRTIADLEVTLPMPRATALPPRPVPVRSWQGSTVVRLPA